MCLDEIEMKLTLLIKFMCHETFVMKHFLLCVALYGKNKACDCISNIVKAQNVDLSPYIVPTFALKPYSF